MSEITAKDANFCQIGSRNMTNQMDELRCSINNFFANLYLHQFYYLCFGLLFLIIFISIFGRIKENYRWFICNQAICDLLLTYDYTCQNKYAEFNKLPTEWCFYNSKEQYDFGVSVIANYIRLNPYSALFLLTLSRFFAIFFWNFYEKLTKKRRIFLTILVFDFIILAFYIPWGAATFWHTYRINQCTGFFPKPGFAPKPGTQCIKDILLSSIYQLTSTITKYSFIPVFSLVLFYCFCSIILAYTIFFRILKQAKFQKSHSTKAFFASLRISAVLLLQTSINSFVLILEALSLIEKNVSIYLNIRLLTSTTSFDPKLKYDLDLRLPLWIDGNFGLATDVPRQTVSQIRVFLDSLIVLLLMTGYREAIVNFFKFCIFVICRPKKAYRIALSRTGLNSTVVQVY